MGLIKAISSAIGGNLADQWKDFYSCDSLSSEVLVAKGKRTVSSRSSNKKGYDNIITKDSVIVVSVGQCMIITDQGKIVEFSATPGEYIYDQSTEPSLFSGSLGESIIDTFKSIGQRFTFGGDPAKDQRIYYINTKEILNNKYGTASPVPFRVVDQKIGLDIDIAIRCNGEFSFKIIDPLLFYTNVSANVSDYYEKSNIEGILRTELLTNLQEAFAKISLKGIRYSNLPAHTNEISDELNTLLSNEWEKRRGLKIVSFGINSVVASKEDEELIKNLQRTAVFQNTQMAAAMLTEAQAEAMKNAAANEGQGAFMAFAGLNMAQQAGGVNATNLYNMNNQNNINNQMNNQNNYQQNQGNTWTCSCGQVNNSKFCSNCGNRQNQQIKCDKCGFIPDMTKSIPKFCPECGDKIDENDK